MLKRVKVGNKIAKVPFIMQMEALECGAASLCMICAYYNKWIPLEKVRYDCDVSRDGSNVRNLGAAAKNYGFTAKCFRMSPEYLENKVEFPCIIHWNFNHFVVLNGFAKNYVSINDPALGKRKVSREEFDKSFTGICLTLKPNESFQPGGKKKSTLEFVRNRLKGSFPILLFVFLGALFAKLFDLLSPAFSRVFMDYLLPGKNREWIMPFFLIFGLISVIKIALSYIVNVNMKRVEGKMDVVGTSSFMWKVLKLPMNFFSQRFSADVESRLSSNATLVNVIVNTIAPLGLEVIMMFLYLSVMLRYNVWLGVIGVASVMINFAVSRVSVKKNSDRLRLNMRDSGKMAGMERAGIEMIESIQSSGAENGFFEKWAGYQANVLKTTAEKLRFESLAGVIPAAVSQITSVIVLGLAAGLTIKGQFTAGMIMAFQSVLGSFSAPAGSLISAGQMMEQLRTEMERIEDVMEYGEDPAFREEHFDDTVNYGKLKGEIELKGVTFGYSRLRAPLIEDFSMKIAPGSKVAFVGTSGCGKSTMAKLITGLYAPWSGEILYDGKPAGEHPRAVLTGSVAIVDQDICLFEDTIANNIKMFDNTVDNSDMIRAAKDAGIHDDILAREKGYDYCLKENAGDFSGGQRQRLEIARALAHNPSVLIMDEATSALDAKTEFEVMQAVAARGITCILIAHRLSTIRDCDEIVVLDRGHVAERGTHEELCALNGVYANMIRNQ